MFDVQEKYYHIQYGCKPNLWVPILIFLNGSNAKTVLKYKGRYLLRWKIRKHFVYLTDDFGMYVFVSSIPKTMIMVGRHQFDTSCFLSNASWWLERNNNLTKTLIKFDQATKNTFRRFYPWIKRDDNTKDFFQQQAVTFFPLH